MSGEKLLEKLELVDPAYVQAASEPPAATKRPWTRWAAGAAACVCLLASAAAVAAGGGFILLTRQVRRGDTLTVFPLLPAMFFSVFFVLAVYLPEESDPVLSRFYIPVLAAAMAAAAFSLLAAFLRQEGNLRTFTFVGNLSVMFCLAAAAAWVGGDWAKAPLFLGCALVLSVFLFLSREHPVPLPEEEKPDPKAPAAEEA